jgi:hypothetical protein
LIGEEVVRGDHGDGESRFAGEAAQLGEVRGCCVVVAAHPVVFDLHGDDWTALCRHVVGQFFAQSAPVRGDQCHERGVCLPDLPPAGFRGPDGDAPHGAVLTDEWSESEHAVHARLGDPIDERAEIVVAVEIEHALAGFVRRPRHGDLDAVEPEVLRAGEP